MKKPVPYFMPLFSALILASALNCRGEDYHSPSRSLFFANAGMGYFSSEGVSGEISQWFQINTTFSILNYRGFAPPGVWLGFSEGLYLGSNRKSGYVDFQMATGGPVPATYIGLSAGMEFQENGGAIFQNAVWFSIPFILSPTLSAGVKYEPGGIRPDIAIRLKFPFLSNGLGGLPEC